MFIKDENGLVFIKSNNIKVFPCGRRRSAPVDADGKTNTVSDRYYIPFDPEARLNTEANNRKHSSLNGFKQNYLSYWDTSGELSFVLAGYVFTISSPYKGANAVNDFGKALEETLNIAEAEHIYANIRLANIDIFSSIENKTNLPSASTEILCGQGFQSNNQNPLEYLDLFFNPSSEPTQLDTIVADPNNYYFYGLSFSSVPTDSNNCVSLQLIDKKDNTWVIHEAARLPKIDHGDIEDSVKVTTLIAEAIYQNNRPVATLELAENTNTGHYQLKFSTKNI
jgi:hypothetical protein